MFRSTRSNSDLLMTFQKVLRVPLPGNMIPGDQRPNPSLSFLRFVPSRTHISRPPERIEENSVTRGDSAVS